jgi:hypothetical protein
MHWPLNNITHSDQHGLETADIVEKMLKILSETHQNEINRRGFSLIIIGE